MLSTSEIQKNREILNETDKSMVATFKVLSDLNRYRIFRILAEQPKLTVSAIATILNISLPLTSQHIKILESANIIQKERDGKKVFPKLYDSNPFVQAIVKTIQDALKISRIQ
jgi:DNA-binding transcriptional ArsR family regulator